MFNVPIYFPILNHESTTISMEPEPLPICFASRCEVGLGRTRQQLVATNLSPLSTTERYVGGSGPAAQLSTDWRGVARSRGATYELPDPMLGDTVRGRLVLYTILHDETGQSAMVAMAVRRFVLVAVTFYPLTHDPY